MDLKEQIRVLALAETPKEVCGFVFQEGQDLVASQRDNVHENPYHEFAIAPKEYLDAVRTKKLHGYFHSHVAESSVPSQGDKIVCEQVRLPLYIYSVRDDTLECYRPTGVTFPLEGRPFILGINDCAGLVIDYYRQVLNISLPDFTRTSEQVINGFPDLLAYASRNGFMQVTETRQNDVVLMKVGHPQPVSCNHVGVLVEPAVMLHQLISRPFARTVYGGYWQRATHYILRHTRLA